MKSYIGLNFFTLSVYINQEKSTLS